MDFGVMLGQAYQVFVQQLHAHLAAHGYQLTGASYGYTLRALSEGPLTASQLAGQLGITAQGAAKVADEMVRHGYLERRPDPADKRAKTLHLSDRGRDVLGKVRQFHADYEQQLVARVGADQVAIVRAVLATIGTDAADSATGRAFRPL